MNLTDKQIRVHEQDIRRTIAPMSTEELENKLELTFRSYLEQERELKKRHQRHAEQLADKWVKEVMSDKNG